MKLLSLRILPFILLGMQFAIAGGPDFEARNVRVDEVRRGPYQGWIIVLSGSGVLHLDKPGSEGKGQAIELVMEKTEIVYHPDLLNAVRPDKSAAYAERLKALVGKNIPEVQAWHVSATIEGGRLTRMVLDDIRPFAPLNDEAYYRRSDIEQLSTWDSSTWKPKVEPNGGK